MLSYYIVPGWLKYPSSLANGHLAGFDSDYAIDARGEGAGGRLVLFVFTAGASLRGSAIECPAECGFNSLQGHTYQ